MQERRKEEDCELFTYDANDTICLGERMTSLQDQKYLVTPNLGTV